jgi:hypothetical protein
MQKLTIIAGLLFLIAASLAVVTSERSAAEEPKAPPKPADGSFAVVELFTSEGCSSCPPADDLLGEIAADAQQRGVAIFPIAFHIDYWDGLGWRDRFSLADSTDRQQRYAKALGSQIYTPQMIVNGRTQFVGSDRDAYRRAVADALSAPAVAQLSFSLKTGRGGTVSIGYKTTSAPPGCVLNMVIVQRSATTDVPRGENAGHTLHHINIARSIKTIPLEKASGEIELSLPDDLAAKDALIIGYLQKNNSLEILAADRIDPLAANGPAR